MRRVVLLVVGLSIAGTAWAGKGPALMQPLYDEVAVNGPVDPKLEKALNAVERCAKTDEHWQNLSPGEVNTHDFYEMLSTAVVCWQAAERKVMKSEASTLEVKGYVVTRARLTEGIRSYVWLLMAKAEGESRMAVCRRLQSAIAETAQAGQSAGVMPPMKTDPGKALAAELRVGVKDLQATMAQEQSQQDCTPR